MARPVMADPFADCRCADCAPSRNADAIAGAYWLGMLGFALAGPAATERAIEIMLDAVSWCDDGQQSAFEKSVDVIRHGDDWERE